MDSRMCPGASPQDGPTPLLCRIVSDPAQIESLHEVFGGFCHQSRNLLNSLKLSIYLERRNSSSEMKALWNELEPRYLAAERIFDRLQAICRTMALSVVRLPLNLLIEERRTCWAQTLAARGRHLELVPPCAPTIGDYDPNRLGQGFDDFVAWRAEAGDPGVPLHLRWWAENGRFQLHWIDASDFGYRNEVGVVDLSDALTLSFLARIMSAHGGSLSLEEGKGLHVRLHWPLDVRSSP